MPFMYSAASQQNTNASANTDTLLADLKTASANAGLRAYLQKLQCGSYVTPADNAIRLRLNRLATVGTYASGASLTPTPLVPDAPASASLASTLPTLGTGTFNAVPLVQLAFNQRGTGLWAAFTADEAVGISGSNAAANGIMVLDSQSTGTTVPVNYKMIFSE
jgi:hypothetical protein